MGCADIDGLILASTPPGSKRFRAGGLVVGAGLGLGLACQQTFASLSG
jgi:hypothetical protein